MQVEKGGDKAHVLLRDQALMAGFGQNCRPPKWSSKVRQHLAAIKPQKDGLMLELMHFPEELLADSDRISSIRPAKTVGASRRLEHGGDSELIKSMTTARKWRAGNCINDDYHEALEKLSIEKKVRARRTKKLPA